MDNELHEEFDNLVERLCNNHKKLRMKYDQFQPSPVLDAGMWGWNSQTREILMVIRFSTSNPMSEVRCIDIKGYIGNYTYKYLIPHTFIESDLALLNTDEVKYKLKHEDSDYWVVATKQSDLHYWIYPMFKSIHEAIAEAFTQVLAMNLLRKQIGEK